MARGFFSALKGIDAFGKVSQASAMPGLPLILRFPDHRRRQSQDKDWCFVYDMSILLYVSIHLNDSPQ